MTLGASWLPKQLMIFLLIMEGFNRNWAGPVISKGIDRKRKKCSPKKGF